MSRTGLLTHLARSLRRKGGPASGPSSVTPEQIREFEKHKRQKLDEFFRRLEEARRKRKPA